MNNSVQTFNTLFIPIFVIKNSLHYYFYQISVKFLALIVSLKIKIYSKVTRKRLSKEDNNRDNIKKCTRAEHTHCLHGWSKFLGFCLLTWTWLPTFGSHNSQILARKSSGLLESIFFFWNTRQRMMLVFGTQIFRNILVFFLFSGISFSLLSMMNELSKPTFSEFFCVVTYLH